jgi:hypothetical protein
MISGVVGASTLGFVIGYDAQRKFLAPTLGAVAYVFVSTIALAITSYIFIGANGIFYAIISELFGAFGRFMFVREVFGRVRWI